MSVQVVLYCCKRTPLLAIGAFLKMNLLNFYEQNEKLLLTIIISIIIYRAITSALVIAPIKAAFINHIFLCKTLSFPSIFSSQIIHENLPIYSFSKFGNFTSSGSYSYS